MEYELYIFFFFFAAEFSFYQSPMCEAHGQLVLRLLYVFHVCLLCVHTYYVCIYM